MVAELGKRFARFREEHPRGTRIPEELRTAVVAALVQGVGSREVERACGVSWGQVRAWQAQREPRAAPVEEKEVRVFSVVEEAPGAERPPAVATSEQALELRLGPWSVSVRLAERGGACSR
jgi:hypothetical protein